MSPQTGGSAVAPQVSQSTVGGSVNTNIYNYYNCVTAASAPVDTGNSLALQWRMLVLWAGKGPGPTLNPVLTEIVKRQLGNRVLLKTVQKEHKSTLEQTFKNIFEGIAKQGNPTLLNRIYTELYITEGEREGVNDEHEVWQIESAYRTHSSLDTPINCNDIFKCLPGQERTIRTVLTKGIAGIGKTVSVQKLSNVKKATSVDVLLTNLIKRILLPSALLWITTRPAAASQIPPEYVDQVTEIRGFNDPQKEEYFHKRFSDEDLANRIISHIQSSRSLYIMCHIPVFCWISATVLEEMLGNDGGEEIPTTLTQMYTHFLLIQTNIKKKKYNFSNETNTNNISQSDRDIIMKLGELAFYQLEKGNVIFYEEDLRECGIDVSEASLYSGVCTQIFKKESVMYQKKVYCFVHLSIQEYIAALYVFQTHASKNMDSLTLFAKKRSGVILDTLPLSNFHKGVVDKALKSKNGHLDLFLRFFLGVSLDSNKSLLQGFLTPTESSSESIKKTIKYIKGLRRKGPSPERCINLLHCLLELNDNSLVEEVQNYLQSSSEKKLSPAQCTSLAYVLLMSKKVLDVFDMKKYNTSEEGCIRLLPVIKCCRKALLTGCKLTASSFETVLSGLQAPMSHLRELDLSYCDLGDSAVRLLCDALKSPNCKIHKLGLGACRLTKESCEVLVSTIQSVNFLLKDLQLLYNDLGDSGVKLLSVGLMSQHCKLQMLGLSGCKLTEESCGSLVSALQSVNSQLTELDLSYNHLGDSGVKELCTGLMSPHCKLQTLRLCGTGLTEGCCESLASALKCPQSGLTDLELSDNDLLDHSMTLLSAGLEDSCCKLQKLGLSLCRVTGRGCSSLASALGSNPRSQLRELDLSYNHPGDSGLTLDPNTAHRKLTLSEDNRTVTWRREEKPYPAHPERFDTKFQVLCREAQRGRAYWEVQWTGGFGAAVGVTYKGISRKGGAVDILLGRNDKSWSLECSGTSKSYTARHGDSSTSVSPTPSLSPIAHLSLDGPFQRVRVCLGGLPRTIAVYLDVPAGTLSFYTVSFDELTLLHRFTSTFTEPLYPGFRVDLDSSLSLCQLE
ncbi:NACHT, LRR and PYD domains-containing protein 3-like [Scleropages formosus]|uniref:NACHT, LRR and PYD domains-containing protein 3-like n=1 Tax=Scleropages formosus TaxID=113540 RepID=A0A0P7Y8W1_SCLFO|nr:NACHT, LRR and PYD domains-containing protein 3-like [Scleropages formosus]